jgi:hypothetical protein
LLPSIGFFRVPTGCIVHYLLYCFNDKQCVPVLVKHVCKQKVQHVYALAIKKRDVTTKEHVEKLMYLIKLCLWPWIIERHAKWRWNKPVKFNRDTKLPVAHKCNYSTILVNNQLDAQFFLCIYLLQFSTCFEHPCAHHQKNQFY